MPTWPRLRIQWKLIPTVVLWDRIKLLLWLYFHYYLLTEVWQWPFQFVCYPPDRLLTFTKCGRLLGETKNRHIFADALLQNWIVKRMAKKVVHQCTFCFERQSNQPVIDKGRSLLHLHLLKRNSCSVMLFFLRYLRSLHRSFSQPFKTRKWKMTMRWFLVNICTIIWLQVRKSYWKSGRFAINISFLWGDS